MAIIESVNYVFQHTVYSLQFVKCIVTIRTNSRKHAHSGEVKKCQTHVKSSIFLKHNLTGMKKLFCWGQLLTPSCFWRAYLNSRSRSFNASSSSLILHSAGTKPRRTFSTFACGSPLTEVDLISAKGLTAVSPDTPFTKEVPSLTCGENSGRWPLLGMLPLLGDTFPLFCMKRCIDITGLEALPLGSSTRLGRSCPNPVDEWPDEPVDENDLSDIVSVSL